MEEKIHKLLDIIFNKIRRVEIFGEAIFFFNGMKKEDSEGFYYSKKTNNFFPDLETLATLVKYLSVENYDAFIEYTQSWCIKNKHKINQALKNKDIFVNRF